MPPSGVGADEEHLRAFRRVLADRVELPTGAFVVDQPVTVLEIEYEGHPRRGLTVRCRTEQGGEHVVGLADVRFSDGSEAARQVANYRMWLGLDMSPAARIVTSRSRADSQGAGDDLDLSHPVDLVVLSVKERAARCRLLASDRTITLRSAGLWEAVPGEIVRVRPRKHWRYAGHPYLSGEIAAHRLDVAAFGLAPLRLEPCGTWDPAEEYWGEEGETLDDWARDVIGAGPRPEFEMEQVLPGTDPNEPDLDPIIESNDLKEAGDPEGARRMLMTLLETDLRCLDAHALLGNLAFDHSPRDALRHYEVGVRIGELSLGDRVNVVLRWGYVDNRPFLRCTQGYGLCLWRLGRWEEALEVFGRILWMNPSDNQGIRFLLPAVRHRRPWEDDQRSR